MDNRLIEAMLVLCGGHYNKEIADIAVASMIPAVLYSESGVEWHGNFKDYLEKMNVDYYTAYEHVSEFGELKECVTCGDVYHAVAMMLADYGLAIHGDMRVAYKLAYGYLTDPDKN